MDAIDRQADKLCKLEITVKEKKINWHGSKPWNAWKPIFKGTIRVSDLKVHTLDIPVSTTKAVVELSWMGDCSKYPTSDLDLHLSGAAGESVTAAALNSPERVVIHTPTLDHAPSKWKRTLSTLQESSAR